jgi:hypothetical protein
VALHRVFHTPQDAIVFDVGHQSYTHKILTGRKDRFDSMRQENGLSGFPNPQESIHDPMIEGHGNTALSQAIGLAQAKKLRLDPPRRVYTLTFSPAGVHIVNDMKADEEADLEWKKIPAAFRRKKAIYLYAAPTRAFILPDGQGDASQDELWAMLVKHLRKGCARQ